ncbi:hypothetical protein ACQ4WX_06105 [Streptomyces lasalocidi]
MIFDHVPVEFATWDDIDAVGAKNITVQNPIIADPIGQRFAVHTEGGPVTWYRDVFADVHNRNPRGQGRHPVRGERRVRLPGRVHGRELRRHLPARRGRQRLHHGTGHRHAARRHGARRRRGRHRPLHPWSPTSTSPAAAAGSARSPT